jgi:hypothetical protein
MHRWSAARRIVAIRRSSIGTTPEMRRSMLPPLSLRPARAERVQGPTRAFHHQRPSEVTYPIDWPGVAPDQKPLAAVLAASDSGGKIGPAPGGPSWGLLGPLAARLAGVFVFREQSDSNNSSGEAATVEGDAPVVQVVPASAVALVSLSPNRCPSPIRAGAYGRNRFGRQSRKAGFVDEPVPWAQ